ncbi:rRNA maturation RNase YbeY [Peptoniphilus sp. KCTC 25270]|uniref:rRNA maturation RNase YbeY n=1 Tax=Peptoniphilus sp. KCTC 25270 TaxID=2897414 RepID=UPI001E46A118|nr:rRNA maturation RNase YbeY [Peptoniphilus sp. KCTC 25270]MCD1146863.1 rRNA maturation RNase YbeY [Peptoniphilus sp. KCTC 25270]
MIDFYIDDRQVDFPVTEKEIEFTKNLLTFGIEYLDKTEQIEVSVSFVDDEEIQQLNREYRGIDKVTDVLSFPLCEEYDGRKQLGDIVVNTKQLERQAKEFGHSYRRELMYLVIHSLLHLYGYDHMEEEDKKVMRQLEEEIIEQFEEGRVL